MQELEHLARITSEFSKHSTESRIHCMLANVSFIANAE